jgi:hypothetical protein
MALVGICKEIMPPQVSHEVLLGMWCGAPPVPKHCGGQEFSHRYL